MTSPHHQERDSVRPRVYRPVLPVRILVGGLGLALALVGVAGVVWILAPVTEAALHLLPFPCLAIGLGWLILAAIRKTRIVLWEDSIEFVELWANARFARRDILRWRMEHLGRLTWPPDEPITDRLSFGRHLVMDLVTGEQFTWAWVMKTDDELERWMLGVQGHAARGLS